MACTISKTYVILVCSDKVQSVERSNLLYIVLHLPVLTCNDEMVAGFRFECSEAGMIEYFMEGGSKRKCRDVSILN